MNIIKSIIAKKITDGVIGEAHPPKRGLVEKLMNVKNTGVSAFAAVAALSAAVAELM